MRNHRCNSDEMCDECFRNAELAKLARTCVQCHSCGDFLAEGVTDEDFCGHCHPENFCAYCGEPALGGKHCEAA